MNAASPAPKLAAAPAPSTFGNVLQPDSPVGVALSRIGDALKPGQANPDGKGNGMPLHAVSNTEQPGNPTAVVPLAGARAMGGPVEAGKPYMVGEKGPEVVVPKQSGTVIPNGGGQPSPPGFNPSQMVKPKRPPLSALWTPKAKKPAPDFHAKYFGSHKPKAA